MRVYGLELGDNEYIKLGDGEDLQVYFDGVDAQIVLTSGDLILSPVSGRTYLSYAGSKRLRTHTDGIQLSKDGLNWSGVFEPGETSPSGTTVLGYNGYLYATRLYGDGSGLTDIPASAIVDAGATAGDNITSFLIYNALVRSAGRLYGGSTDPISSTRLNYDGYFYATRVYNAVWNDIADCRKLRDTAKETPGKCYVEDGGAATTPIKRCQKGVLGILSDTYGFGVGAYNDHKPFAIAGWVLAHVDKEYKPGTCLTNDKDGNLTKMKWWEKILFPERIVGTYCNKETLEIWGDADDKVKVNGRHWVKVK